MTKIDVAVNTAHNAAILTHNVQRCRLPCEPKLSLKSVFVLLRESIGIWCKREYLYECATFDNWSRVRSWHRQTIFLALSLKTNPHHWIAPWKREHLTSDILDYNFSTIIFYSIFKPYQAWRSTLSLICGILERYDLPYCHYNFKRIEHLTCFTISLL